MSDENVRDLERSAQSCESLQRLKSKINEDFHISLVPPLAEVKRAASVLQTSGFLRKMFSRECREARQLYKSLAISTGGSSKKKYPGQELARLAAYLQQSHETETNRELQRYAGRFYRGLDTPWRELISVSQWASKVRQTFPPQPNGSNAICAFLLEADLEKIDSIVVFGKSREHAFLVQEIAKSPGWPAPSLTTLVGTENAAAQASEELTAQLQGLTWNPRTTFKDLERISGELKISCRS
jgi:hypothetical protein